MILSNLVQLSLLWYSILAGIFTGILFDIYRVLRGSGPKNKIISFIEDMLFWILAAILIFVFLLWKTGAIINIYVFSFVGIGIYLYIMIFSNRLIKHYRKMLLKLLKAIRIISNLIIFPFRIIKYILLKKQ